MSNRSRIILGNLAIIALLAIAVAAFKVFVYDPSFNTGDDHTLTLNNGIATPPPLPEVPGVNPRPFRRPQTLTVQACVFSPTKRGSLIYLDRYLDRMKRTYDIKLAGKGIERDRHIGSFRGHSKYTRCGTVEIHYPKRRPLKDQLDSRKRQQFNQGLIFYRA